MPVEEMGYFLNSVYYIQNSNLKANLKTNLAYIRYPLQKDNNPL